MLIFRCQKSIFWKCCCYILVLIPSVFLDQRPKSKILYRAIWHRATAKSNLRGCMTNVHVFVWSTYHLSTNYNSCLTNTTQHIHWVNPDSQRPSHHQPNNIEDVDTLMHLEVAEQVLGSFPSCQRGMTLYLRSKYQPDIFNRVTE